MPESLEDQISRVEMMSNDDGGTWDLSVKDKAALKALLATIPKSFNMTEPGLVFATKEKLSPEKMKQLLIDIQNAHNLAVASNQPMVIHDFVELVSTYDSAPETLKHIARVGDFLAEFAKKIVERASRHDHSKLLPPEKEAFDIATPRLRNLTYGSPEYKASLDSIRPAVDHHQKNNTHHAEFYDDGINGMDLLDLVEMICDWRAAGERHENGGIGKSLEVNKERFKISDQLYDVLCNTAIRMGWL